MKYESFVLSQFLFYFITIIDVYWTFFAGKMSIGLKEIKEVWK